MTVYLFLRKIQTSKVVGTVTVGVKILGLVFWVFAASACAGGNGRSSIRPADDKEDISVEVRNENFYDATVYAYGLSSRTRLGVVESHSTRSFEFRWITGDLRFLVDFFANGCLLTSVMSVDRGDDLLLILQAQDYRKSSQSLCRR